MLSAAEREDAERIAQHPAQDPALGTLGHGWGLDDVGHDSAHLRVEGALGDVHEQIHDDDDHHGDDGHPHDDGDVALSGRGDQEGAGSGDREDLLQDDDTAEEADELQAEHGQTGGRGAAQHVLEHDLALSQPPAAERPDVVLVEFFDDGAADLLGAGGHVVHHDRDHREAERDDPRLRPRPGADGGDGREPAEVHREDRDEEERQHEPGNRITDHRADLYGLIHPSATDGGENPECRRDERHEHDRHDHQDEGDGQAVEDRLRDRLAVEPGLPQVAAQRRARPSRDSAPEAADQDRARPP